MNRTLTREHKIKISEANKGKHMSLNTEFKLGHSTSLEIRAKISKANKGNYHSQETKTKISKTLMGREITQEWKNKISNNRLERKERLGYLNSSKTRQKISETLKGRIPWNKGLHPKGHSMSEETKRKIGEGNKGKVLSQETKDKIGRALKGRKSFPMSQETKNKIGKSNKGKVRSQEFKDRISKSQKGRILTKEHIKNILHRRIPSSLEEKFQKIIDKYSLPYKFVGDGKFFIERYNPDFINTNNEKIAVEVYARYYKKRNYENIEEWKEERQKVFNKYGWKVIYFNETEVNEKYILEKIKRR